MTTSKLRPTETTTTTVVSASADYSSIRQLVRERLELSDEADPGSVVADLLDELPADALRVAAHKGLYVLAGEVARRVYRSPVDNDASRSGRWESVALAEKEHPDVMMERVCVGHNPDGRGIWKFLGDCTKSDLANAAEHRTKLANGILAQAERFERLGRMLKRSQTVRDIDRQKVEAVLNA